MNKRRNAENAFKTIFHSTERFVLKIFELKKECKYIGNFPAGYLVSFNFGAASSWASLSFEDLQKNPSILSFGALDINEASMMVTLANLGGLIGNFLFLPIGEIYGHKRITLWLGPIQIVRMGMYNAKH